MKFKQKLMLLSISLVVIIFILGYGHLNPDSIFSWGKVARQKRIVYKIVDYMLHEDAAMSKEELKDVAVMIYKESEQYKLDYRLVLAIMKVESNFKQDAVSSKGARGLLQVKPSHAKYIAHSLGIRWSGAQTLDKPDNNIKIGVHFFSKLMEDYDNVNMALHAYNIGPTRLKEIMSENNRPNKTFSNLVLMEYGKNKILLPDP